jgi:signal peptidase II
MGRRPVALRRSSAALLGTALCVLAVDQATKALVRAELRPDTWIDLIPGVLRLNHVRNQGAAFGLMWGQRLVFVGVTALVLAGLAFVWFRYHPRGWLVVPSLGLLAGGAIGNLIDRLIAGRVTDFIDVHFWPVFNVADSAIVVGVGILVVWLLFHKDVEDVPAALADGDRDGRAAGGDPDGDPEIGRT